MNVWKASTVVLLGCLGVAIGAPMIGSASAEPQSAMENALRKLHEAKDALEHASSDHGGHRVKAVEHTSEAIHEVEQGIAWAKEHK